MGKSRGREGSAFRVSIGQTRVRRARLTSKGRRIGLGSSSRPEPSRWTTWLARERKGERPTRPWRLKVLGSPIRNGKSLDASPRLDSSADRLQQKGGYRQHEEMVRRREESRTTKKREKKKREDNLDDNSRGSRSQRL